MNNDLLIILSIIVTALIAYSAAVNEKYVRTALHPTPQDEIKRSAERANANAYRNLSGHHRKTSMLALEVRK